MLRTTCNIYTVWTKMHGSLITQQVVLIVTMVLKTVTLVIRYSVMTRTFNVQAAQLVFLYYNHTQG